jgi:GNAT superfamily N-acetyltransferase
MINQMEKLKNIKIVEATSKEELDHVRQLFREFVKWHMERNKEDIGLLGEYFGAAFEEELRLLPGKYAKPKGSLLLAYYDDQPAGCVALREIDKQSCEMKRMFVGINYHRKGVGRVLAENIIGRARSIGYVTMKLDTSFRQTEAQELYQSMGFKKTKAYYELPKKVEDWLVFMELAL